jgi:hypothetical protein
VDKIYLPIPVPKVFKRIGVWFLLRYRKKHYGFTFRRIKLTKDKPVGQKPAAARYAIVDVEDYEKLAQYDWQLSESESKKCYAVCLVNRKIVSMHRVIMNAPAGMFVDHRYGDGLDNRKENLRIATMAQNQYNRRKTSRKTSSKYKGVHLKKQYNKYGAEISCNGKRTHLGYFDNEIDAAKAYDEAAKKLFGEFAKLNFEKYLTADYTDYTDFFTTENTLRRQRLWRTGSDTKKNYLLI